jgi:hypothetical protein
MAKVEFEIMHKLMPHVKFPTLRLPRMPPDPVSAARSTRSEVGLSPDSPIPQLTKVIENCGVVIIAVSVELEKGDAFSLWYHYCSSLYTQWRPIALLPYP